MNIFKYIPFLFVLFGCNGYYRYPCQDPANFSLDQCIEPRCEFDGHCLKDIYGDKYEYVQKWLQQQPEMINQEVDDVR